EKLTRIDATVLRGDVLRIDGLPFITRLPGLADLPRGQRLELDLVATDAIDLTLEARVHRVLAAQTAVDVGDEELVDEMIDGSAAALAEQSAEMASDHRTNEALDPAQGAAAVPSG
ncbi:MAG TPA: RNB domain-containing ribonuclease, partial [Burkholderiaceae bacterium]|nr:RNB domain-containing ribonuclease [Burkholderiaceae bacterium]